MKNLLLIALLLLVYTNAQSQYKIKAYDFKQLENKVLYIPKYEVDSDYAKKLTKKGKFDKLKTTKEKAAFYNEIWSEAMANSAYDATPYEIRSFDSKKLFKEKNKKAIVLMFWQQYKTVNWYAGLWVTGPKKQLIAQTLINGLDLDDEGDIRLMINLLNYSLTMSLELNEEEKKTKYSTFRSKYKEDVIAFEENIENLTFLVPKYVEGDIGKFEKRNAQIKEALKLWNICEYKWITLDEIDEVRAEGDPNSFYWRALPIYSNVGGVSVVMYSLNYLLTCERDDVVFYWLGSKKMKPSQATKIQTEIREDAARYRKKMKE